MKPSAKYWVSIQTRFFYDDGELFADLGTMVFPSVTGAMKAWLADSCKKTARWMVDMEQDDNGLTLEYRTIVKHGDDVISDTGPIRLEYMGYADVVRFERWALDELAEMLDEFVAENGDRPAPVTSKRSKVKTLASWAWTVIRQRWRR